MNKKHLLLLSLLSGLILALAWMALSGAGNYGLAGFGRTSASLINLVLFFRIFEIAYFEPFEDHHAVHPTGHGPVFSAVQEAPLELLVPLVATAALLFALGIYAGDIVSLIIDKAIPVGIV
jgi:multicomponent Na+:H+ antiporter subunit D